MKRKKDVVFKIVAIIFAIVVLASIVKLEIDVQRRWDAYEAKVFAEMEVRNGSR